MDKELRQEAKEYREATKEAIKIEELRKALNDRSDRFLEQMVETYETMKAMVGLDGRDNFTLQVARALLETRNKMRTLKELGVEL